MSLALIKKICDTNADARDLFAAASIHSCLSHVSILTPAGFCSSVRPYV